MVGGLRDRATSRCKSRRSSLTKKKRKHHKFQDTPLGSIVYELQAYSMYKSYRIYGYPLVKTPKTTHSCFLLLCPESSRPKNTPSHIQSKKADRIRTQHLKYVVLLSCKKWQRDKLSIQNKSPLLCSKTPYRPKMSKESRPNTSFSKKQGNKHTK